MSNPRDVYPVVLQLLRESGYKETAHMFERETRLFFDMAYLDELLLIGNWRKAVDYLSDFAEQDNDKCLIKTFVKIWRVALLEALESKDRNKAVDILTKDLKFLLPIHEDLYNDMTNLLTLNDIREHPTLKSFPKDTMFVRTELSKLVKDLINSNPVFNRKLELPCIQREILSSIRNQGYNVPRIVALTLNIDSSATSMDFHPHNPVLLLVGTCVGDVSLFDLSQKKLLFQSKFTVWKPGLCSEELRTILASDATESMGTNNPTATMGYPRASVKRIVWSPNGLVFGVAYSKSLVQLYSCFNGGRDIKRELEFEAHTGFPVNDLAFCSPFGELWVITCGDDKKIQVWSVETGRKKFTLEGHEAPVYSVCPHVKKQAHFFFSTSVDGNIKAWFYRGAQPELDFKGPVLGRLKLVYEGKRLFGCATNDDGQSVLVEWNDRQGSIKRFYEGLDARQSSVVQFGIINNILAAAHDHVIKFWNMNDKKLLGFVEAEGLPATPQICFNKKGTLLAVEATENRIKIIATDEGFCSLQSTKRAEQSDIFRKSEIAESSDCVKRKRSQRRPSQI